MYVCHSLPPWKNISGYPGHCADPRIVLGLNVYTLVHTHVSMYVAAYPHGWKSILGYYADPRIVLGLIDIISMCVTAYPHGEVSRDAGNYSNPRIVLGLRIIASARLLDYDVTLYYLHVIQTVWCWYFILKHMDS